SAPVRFHVGEWPWSPLNGLRSISEFLSFPFPSATPLRIGHALALSSEHWESLADEPLDDVVDDLIWARLELHRHGSRAELVRECERTLLDLVPEVFPEISELDIAELCDAYEKMVRGESLHAVGFIANTPLGDLYFPDFRPVPSGSAVLAFAQAHLTPL